MNLVHRAVAVVAEAESLWCVDSELAHKRACAIVRSLIDHGFLKGRVDRGIPFEPSPAQEKAE